MEKRRCRIVDVDGTLVDVSSIRHHVLGLAPDGSYQQSDFGAFHEAAINCPPIQETLDKVAKYKAQGDDIVIVTARSTKYGRQTAFWLAMYDVPSDGFFMRRQGDNRKDVEVKRDILRFILERWDVAGCIDDNPHVVALWEEFNFYVDVVPGYSE